MAIKQPNWVKRGEKYIEAPGPTAAVTFAEHVKDREAAVEKFSICPPLSQYRWPLSRRANGRRWGICLPKNLPSNVMPLISFKLDDFAYNQRAPDGGINGYNALKAYLNDVRQ